jgi:hypothetical protein
MDNRYFANGCPPLMSDGRFITNHLRYNVFDQFIRNMNDIGSNHEYRHFLQNNANQILNKERKTLVENNTCNVNGKCVPVSGKATNLLPCSTCYTQKSKK